MTEVEQIEAAKAAIGRATPGHWWACCTDPDAHSHFVFAGPGECCVCNLTQNDPTDKEYQYEPLAEIVTRQERQANALLLQAAPALVRRVQELEDWQVRALPWLKDEVYRREKLAAHIYKSCAYMPDGDFYTTDDLTALIEQAEGGKE